MVIPPNSVILFQGDSVTDTGRNRVDTTSHSVWALGSSYALMAAAELLLARPGDNLRFYNRAIGGERIVDLDARIKRDAIALKPDILSVQVGANDALADFEKGEGVPPQKFERVYREYLAEIRESLPGIQLALCEPFVLPCGPVTAEWIATLEEYRTIVRRLADQAGAVFIPFQSIFDEALKDAPAEFWAPDGQHPSAPGQLLLARAWLRYVCGS